LIYYLIFVDEKPGIMGHVYTPSYSGGRGRKIEVYVSLGKSLRPYLNNKLNTERI
jgi:hypothetical protein